MELPAPQPEGTVAPKTGMYTSQGVGRVGAPAWHTAGLTGARVEVAVVDTNFVAFTASQAAGDLPSGNRLTTMTFCNNGLTRNFDPATSPVDRQRGTDAAEVVADMAPGADIRLVCIDSGSVVDAEAAVDDAVAQGIRIMVSDVRFFDNWRGDGAGPAGTIDAVVANARARGVLWIQAAGETGQQNYRGAYNPNGAQFHQWQATDQYNDVFQVAAGESFTVFLQWDQWPTSAQDYVIRIYQLDAQGQPVSLAASSARGPRRPRRSG